MVRRFADERGERGAMFRYGWSTGREDDLFDDEIDDLLDSDLDEFTDPNILPNPKDLDQEFYQRIRNRGKASKKDRSGDEYRSKNKRRRQKDKTNKRDPDWNDFNTR
jgi:hypothetical protein